MSWSFILGMFVIFLIVTGLYILIVIREEKKNATE